MDDMSLNGRTGPIEVLGLGMGGDLDRADMERLQAADVLAGGARLLKRFAHLPGERIVLAAPLPEALERIAQARDRGLRVVVLADGDPLYFGIGTRLLARFGPDALRFTPGVTAVAAACARLGLPWQDLPAVSMHGRDTSGPLLAVLAALVRAGRVAVYTDPVNSPDALARLLIEQGLEEARLWVLEDLAAPEERVRRLGAPEAAGLSFSPLNLVIVEMDAASDAPEDAPGRARPMLGRPDDFYAKEHGLITKWPARACALAALRLQPDSILWDVGAGSGSISIEACALITSGRVFAVERDPERCRLIRENIRRSGAWLVKTVAGEAPGAFADLPDPDRIFLGGSLGGGSPGRSPETLAATCRRLRPGGRVVANTVLLGSLTLALEHFRALGWSVETTQVQASLSAPLAGDARLVAHNPVFIIAADKPA